MVQAYCADRIPNCRAWMMLSGCLQSIVGTVLYSKTTNTAARYIGTFLAVGGANGNVGLILSWAQCSIRQQSKRGFTSAIIVAMGGIGGILASTLFMDSEALQVSFTFKDMPSPSSPFEIEVQRLTVRGKEDAPGRNFPRRT